MKKKVKHKGRSQDWRSYKELWTKYKIYRNKRKQVERRLKMNPDNNEFIKEHENYLKTEMESAKKIVKIAKNLKDKHGKPIAIPFFAYLGNEQ